MTIRQKAFAIGGGYLLLFAVVLLFTRPAGLRIASLSTSPGARKQKWTFRIGTGTSTGLAVGPDGAVYVGGRNLLYAIAPNGKLLWEHSLGAEGVKAAPVVGPDGTVYMATIYGAVYAVASDGQRRWQSFGNYSGIDASPGLDGEGTLYVVYTTREIDVFQESRSRPFQGRLVVDPVRISDDRVLFGGYFASSRNDTSPVLAADATLFVSRQSWLHAFTPQGEQIWAMESPAGGWFGNPAIGPDGTLYLGDSRQTLYAVDRAGNKKWAFSTQGTVVESPTIDADGTIYFCDDKTLTALLLDGTVKWQFSPRWGCLSSPTLAADGTLYFGARVDGLVALNHDGTLKWNDPAGGTNSAPVIAPDGTIYVLNNGGVAAYWDAGAGLMPHCWPRLHHDSQNTGRSE